MPERAESAVAQHDHLAGLERIDGAELELVGAGVVFDQVDPLQGLGAPDGNALHGARRPRRLHGLAPETGGVERVEDERDAEALSRVSPGIVAIGEMRCAGIAGQRHRRGLSERVVPGIIPAC